MSPSSHASPGSGMTVTFCCDLGAGIGIGHLMRCLALAEAYLAEGDSVRFLVDTRGVPLADRQLAARGIEHAPPPSPDRPEEYAAALAGHGADLVVIDSYLLPLTIYAAVRATGLPLLALVDGDPQGREADLYLDQNIGAEADTWALAAGSRRLAGLDYALQREDIRALRPQSPDAHRESVPVSVLAFFGGTDAFGIAPHVAGALVATGVPFDLTVVAARDETRSALEALAPVSGQRINVIPPTDRLSELVVDSDVVVAAAGTSLWELACLGAAAAVVAVADNQVEAYGRVLAGDLFVGLGMLAELADDPASATARLRALLTDPARRAQLRARAWATVDGLGARRVVNASREVAGLASPE